MSSRASSSRHHSHHGRHRKHSYRKRYIIRRVIGHKRYHFDELVNNWRFLETSDADLGISRVIDINFISGSRAAIKINHINNIYQYSIIVPREVDNECEEDQDEIHAVETLLNSGRVVRFRFNTPDKNTGGKANASLFYNELINIMNLASQTL